MYHSFFVISFAGYYLSAGNCVACAANSYSASGSTSCTPAVDTQSLSVNPTSGASLTW